MKIAELLHQTKTSAMKQVNEELRTKGEEKFFEDALNEIHNIQLSETGQEAFDMVKSRGQQIFDHFSNGDITSDNAIEQLVELKEEISILGKLEIPTSQLNKEERDEVFLYKGALMWVNNLIKAIS